MKILIAAVAALVAMPLMAQTADHSMHSAAPAAAAAAQSAARLNLDTPVETIVADASGKAVLDADLPGVTTHEHYDMFKSMSLRALSGMAPDKLKPEVLAKVEADLAAIK
jgi:hypothetical protein